MVENNNAMSLDKMREAAGKVARNAFEKAGIAGREAAFDEGKFNMAVDVAYRLIPLPMRLVISKERFSGVMSELRDQQFGAK